MTLISEQEILLLNRARSLLKQVEKRCGDAGYAATGIAQAGPFGLGRCAEAAQVADHDVFQTLNSLRAYGGAKIEDDLMHNRIDTRVVHAEDVSFDSDEDGWKMTVSTDDGDTLTFNVQGIALQFADAARSSIVAYANEAQEARYTLRPVTDEDLEGYDPDDPKRITLMRERGEA